MQVILLQTSLTGGSAATGRLCCSSVASCARMQRGTEGFRASSLVAAKPAVLQLLKKNIRMPAWPRPESAHLLRGRWHCWSMQRLAQWQGSGLQQSPVGRLMLPFDERVLW